MEGNRYMFDLDNLTDSEVKALIETIKELLDKTIQSEPIIGVAKVSEDYRVTDAINHIEYILHLHRGKLEANKYSMHIRFTYNHIHLVRLCINAGNNHINKSDRTNVGKNHIHIYDSSTDSMEYAYNLDNYTFDKNDSLIESFYKFIDFLNIKNFQQEGVDTYDNS